MLQSDSPIHHALGTPTHDRRQSRISALDFGERYGRLFRHLLQSGSDALKYAFEDLNLHRIEADVDPRNTASIKTVERLGFQREGYLRERWQVNGEIQDAYFYGLLRPEWVGEG